MLSFLSLVTIPLLSLAIVVAEENVLSAHEARFFLWTGEHGKKYDSDDERSHRLKVWVENDGM